MAYTFHGQGCHCHVDPCVVDHSHFVSGRWVAPWAPDHADGFTSDGLDCHPALDRHPDGSLVGSEDDRHAATAREAGDIIAAALTLSPFTRRALAGELPAKATR